MIWHFDWLGYVAVAVALVAFGVSVLARAGSHRVGHVVAAIAAAAGALLSMLAIVRLFRLPGLDSDVAAWLLPAGYLVLLVAVVLSARKEPA